MSEYKFIEGANTPGTNAGSPIPRKKENVQFSSIVDFYPMTTTIAVSKDRCFAESGITTSSGLTLGAYFSGASIRTLRTISGLTWDQLAGLFGVSRRSLHLWDNGNTMRPYHQEKLARIFNAVQLIDTGRPSENRKLLLSSVGGRLALDLLRDDKLEAFAKISEFLSTRMAIPSISKHEALGRMPLAPEALVHAKDDVIHKEMRKVRPRPSRKMKKA
jgi:transcriptional regulator with XRE-family HTH domain